MLTKNDLSQIRGVVREEVENEIDAAKKEIKAGVAMSRMQVQSDIRELKGKIKNVEIGMAKMDKKLDAVQEDVAEYLNTLEPRITKVEKRIDNIDDNLDIHSN